MPIAEIVVLQDSRLDPDRLILEGLDVSEKPRFTVSEVSKIFFGMSPYWIRWLEGHARPAFLFDGKEIVASRTPKGARYYTLADVELMTHALAQTEFINGAQATNALHIVHAMSRVWGYVA